MKNATKNIDAGAAFTSHPWESTPNHRIRGIRFFMFSSCPLRSETQAATRNDLRCYQIEETVHGTGTLSRGRWAGTEARNQPDSPPLQTHRGLQKPGGIHRPPLPARFEWMRATFRKHSCSLPTPRSGPGGGAKSICVRCRACRSTHTSCRIQATRWHESRGSRCPDSRRGGCGAPSTSLKLPGIERKLRVMLDWTLGLFFSPRRKPAEPGAVARTHQHSP